MAERSPGAHVVRRRLGRGLRELREGANIRIEAAARELECSPAKISRLENGQGPAKLWDVRILLTFYGIEDSGVRRRYEQWARGTKSEAWWELDTDLTSDDVDRYFAAETIASRVRTYCALFLPALLRNEDYASAYTRAVFPELARPDVERWVKVQLSRQSQLLENAEAPSFSYEVVVDEAVLLRRVGSVQLQRGQLEWLLHVLERRERDGTAGLDFRVYPLGAGPTRALSNFTIFDPREKIDPPSAYLEESPDGGVWLDSVDEMAKVFDDLQSRAAPPEESLTILREAIEASRRRAWSYAPYSSPKERSE